MSHYDAIIIGAGMSGLAAGIRLAMYDKKVVVLERHYVWGGLNSFYQFQGHQFDVGLHAMTNYAPRGARGLPLTRLLKQLRIRWEELDLHQQGHSAVSFPGLKLNFSNDFELLRSEIARAFPGQIDGFDALTRQVRGYNEFDLNAPTLNAREIVESHTTDPVLADMLFCPLMFYGSARENDMDWDQFVVMFKSIFFEGFARPQAGVRHILKLLIDRYRRAGGELRLKAGVSRIITDGQRATGVELDNGETLTADNVLSSAGLVETGRLVGSAGLWPADAVDVPSTAGADKMSAQQAAGTAALRGKLSFTETISVLDKPARDLGIEETIIFFSNTERFNYAQPNDLCDTSSGVICMPGNFNLPRQPKDHLVRITNIANYDKWAALGSAGLRPAHAVDVTSTADAHRMSASKAGQRPALPYYEAKQHWYARSCDDVLSHIPDFRPYVSLVDMFTPRTIRHYTGHEGGAVYGSPLKKRTGESGVEGLYIIGTDQGFLGIIGAMLSGISMANRWVLQRDNAAVETT
ncbi:MAG: NAD(P)/FAD-dependent oxidoreductase [Planctomycetes bacterium]|nr:NAD(P)/FAD-dependent oxidoreductase [Planctomycetota bacterium]MCB9934623.1 NAD(P)/FAD-dependent oxidoreductase [Planctomycetota bacterium]